MTRINIRHNTKEIIQILEGCKQNDTSAQKKLFEKYSPLIFTVCRRYSSSEYQAKDLLQDTFIKVFEKVHQFDSRKGKAEHWITRIAINLALNTIRKRKIQFVNLEHNLDYVDDFHPPLYDLTEEEILSLINQLPTGYKTIFNLYIIDDFSHKEIARKLKISESTSKSQLYKAKKLLQKLIINHQKIHYGGF